MDEKKPQRLAIVLPLSTILIVIATVALLKVMSITAALFLPSLIAMLIAVALTPIVNWLVARRWPRALALATVTLGLFALLAILIMTIVPSIYQEAVSFFENLPQFQQDILGNLGPNNPFRGILNHALNKDILIPRADRLSHLLGAGHVVIGGFTEVLLIFILSIYFLADGPRIIEWVKPFFEPGTQVKIEQTCYEVSKIVGAYVLGQFLTSLFAFVFVFASLTALDVPRALLLATLAGLFDVLPVLGFFLAVIPAMVFAAGVSSKLSIIVLALYVVFHAIESYVIIPLVYGNRMRVASIVVFLTLLAAGLLGGIEGAIVALPIVASYPIIERIWLRRYLRPEAIIEHSPNN